MKRAILLWLCVCVVFLVSAQVQLVQLPSAPLSFSLADWQQFNAINTGASAIQVTINGEIRDGKSAQTLLRFASTPITLNPGLNAFTESNLELAHLDIINHELGSAFKSRGLPPGAYVACINMVDGEGKGIASSCREVDVAAISPPVLSYPANGSSITEKQPLFTWMPAIVGGANPINVDYHLRLVAKRKGQSKAEALSRNRPLFEQKTEGSAQLPYPAAATALKSGQGYVWQVQAFYKGYPLGSSEVFSFEVGTHSIPVEVKDTVWMQLSPGQVLPNTNCAAVVRVAFKHYTPQEQMHIVIRDHMGKVFVLNENQYQIDHSSHEIIINLSELKFIKQDESYKLEFTRQNHQVLAARITYKVN